MVKCKQAKSIRLPGLQRVDESLIIRIKRLTKEDFRVELERIQQVLLIKIR